MHGSNSPSGGMADALASGASARKGVEVRLLSWALLYSICGCGEIGRQATLRW